MPTFKAGGVEWLLSVDAPKARRVRTETGVDIIARGCEQFQTLANDPALMIDVLWWLCHKQAEGKLDRDAFSSLLSGDVLDEAGRQLFEALIDFFPSGQRTALRQMLAQTMAVQAAAQAEVMAQISSPETLEAMTAKAIADIRAEFAALRNPT